MNKYGRRVIVDGAKDEYLSNLEFVPPEDSYTFSSATNGPCNRSAFLVMHEIEKRQLSTQFAFFHIPKWITGALLHKLLEELFLI